METYDDMWNYKNQQKNVYLNPVYDDDEFEC